MKRSTWGAGAAIAVALLLVAPTAHAADQVSPAAADGSEPSFPAGHLTQVAIPLEHPLSLSDALLEAANYAEKVMAFRYDHDIVVGDYVLTEEYPPEEFLADFAKKYGTQPRVVAFVVERETEALARSADEAASLAETPIDVDAPEVVVDPVTFGADIIAWSEQQRAQTEERKAEEEMGVMAEWQWAPVTASIQLTPHWDYPTRAYLFGMYQWENYRINNLDGQEWGLEFNVDFYNRNVPAPDNVRDLCWDGAYKDHFWAKNNGWYSWSVVLLTGGSLSGSAYADYNDLLDECGRQSIAVGIRETDAIGTGANGVTQLYTEILAPRGDTWPNAISGNVAAESENACFDLWWLSNTDCMGVDDPPFPFGETNRSTLASSRGWTAPWRCWDSPSYGSDPPIEWPCP